MTRRLMMNLTLIIIYEKKFTEGLTGFLSIWGQLVKSLYQYYTMIKYHSDGKQTCCQHLGFQKSNCYEMVVQEN